MATKTDINPLELINVTKAVHSILTDKLPTKNDIEIQAIFSNELNSIENIEAVLQQSPTYLEQHNTLKNLKLQIEEEVENLFPDEEIKPFLEGRFLEGSDLAQPSQQLYKRIAHAIDSLKLRAGPLYQQENELFKTIMDGLRQDLEALLIKTITEQKEKRNELKISGETDTVSSDTIINWLEDYLFLKQLEGKVYTFKQQFEGLQQKMYQHILSHKINRFLKDDNNDLSAKQDQQPATFIFSEKDCTYKEKCIFTNEELRVRALLLEKPSLYEQLKGNFWIKTRIHHQKEPTYTDISKAPALILGQHYYIDNKNDIIQVSHNIQSMYAQLSNFSKEVSPILDAEINVLQKTGNMKMIAMLREIRASLSEESLKQPLKALRDYTEQWNQYESFYQSKYQNKHLSFIEKIKQLFRKLFPSAEIKAHRILSDHLQKQKDAIPTQESVKAIYGFFSPESVNIDAVMRKDTIASATAAQQPPK